MVVLSKEATHDVLDEHREALVEEHAACAVLEASKRMCWACSYWHVFDFLGQLLRLVCSQTVLLALLGLCSHVAGA